MATKPETYWVDVKYVGAAFRTNISRSVKANELASFLTKYSDTNIYSGVFYGRS